MKLAILALLCAAPSPLPQDTSAREPGSRSEWAYTLDLERARAIGWGGRASSAEDVLRIAVGLLERRLRAIDERITVEAKEPGPRIVVRWGGTHEEGEGGALDALVRGLGVVEFALVAEYGRVPEGVDLAQERERLEAWRQSNPEFPLAAFSLVPVAEGGPHPSLYWLPNGTEDSAPWPILLPTSLARAFGAADFERVYPSFDDIGYPAIGFDLRSTRKEEFRAFTRDSVGRHMAIVLDGEVLSAPRIGEELPGSGILRGRFGQEQVDAAIRRIQALEGPLRPSP